jgi:hypothetical protein
MINVVAVDDYKSVMGIVEGFQVNGRILLIVLFQIQG